MLLSVRYVAAPRLTRVHGLRRSGALDIGTMRHWAAPLLQ